MILQTIMHVQINNSTYETKFDNDNILCVLTFFEPSTIFDIQIIFI